MKKHKQNNEYILKEDIGFLKWFRENKNSFLLNSRWNTEHD